MRHAVFLALCFLGGVVLVALLDVDDTPLVLLAAIALNVGSRFWPRRRKEDGNADDA